MDFPNPEEEFELMHAEELEVMNELDPEYDNFPSPGEKHNARKSKRCLDFTSLGAVPSTSKSSQEQVISSQGLVDLTQGYNKTINASSANSSSLVENTLSQTRPETNGNSSHQIIETVHVHKRKAEDLFGDIDDIDLEDDYLLKKSKLEEQYTEEERQLMTIEKIVSERQKLLSFKTLPRLSLEQNLSSGRTGVQLTYSIPKWPFFPLTDGKGERVYARFKSEEYAEREIARIGSRNHSGSLLHVPFNKLEETAHAELQKKWNRIEANNTNTSEIEMVEGNDVNNELWVEKYRPRNYLELLSDEGTNRELLKWLKMWDKVVFNREIRIKKKLKEEKKGRYGGRFQKKTGPVVNEEYDEHGRPFHKIALLCGPPGLGKTTLAHMIASQAGYNIVEVNASDDRSPEVFRTQLEAATQMKAVMGEERRPNCLVLDEIDGAPQASIDVVVKFVEGKGLGRGRNKAKKAAGGAAAAGILKRPIICICNDVYVPALRPLRQLAFVVHFPPTASNRLAQRLCEIAHLQSLKTDLGTMMALSEKTNNDIRACLALLHCLKSQSGNVIRLSQIQSAALGEKDMHKGLFTVWQEIFQIQRTKQKRFVEKTPNKLEPMPDLMSPELKCRSTSLTSRAMSVLRTVQGAGDYDRLAQGVYENFLNMKIKDSSMKSVADGLSWFCHHDLLSTTILSTQNYVLYPYLPYSFVMWHFLFANLSWPKISYPSTGYEMYVRKQRYTQLLDEVMRNMQPYVRAYTHKDQLLLDVGPLLLEIIVPNLRPVSLQLFSQKEKEELKHVTDVMIDYNLTYTQERTQDASYIFNLDPNIEEVCRLNSKKGARVLSYAARQLISREIELEKLRRTEASLYRNASAQPTRIKNTESVPQNQLNSNQTTTPKGPSKKSIPNHLQKLTPKAMKKLTADLQTRDFFGRVIENSLVEDFKKAKTDEIVKSDIWFHFKEGYNNAVRRSVDIKDLY